MTTPTYEDALRIAQQLTPEERRRLSEALAVEDTKLAPPAHESLYGSLVHLGPAPSAEEIDEVRREMWANFGQDDI